MYDSTDRFYSEHVPQSCGKYHVMDRTTGKAVTKETMEWRDAEDLAKRMMKAERGLMNDDQIEIPFSYFPRSNRSVIEVESVVVHK